MCDERSDVVPRDDGKTLAETVSHDRDLTSRLQLEIHSLQETVQQLFYLIFVVTQHFTLIVPRARARVCVCVCVRGGGVRFVRRSGQ